MHRGEYSSSQQQISPQQTSTTTTNHHNIIPTYSMNIPRPLLSLPWQQHQPRELCPSLPKPTTAAKEGRRGRTTTHHPKYP
ncbi:hypothetical protein Pcinc_041698, partial [Petrolisthes cinctipes]